MNEEDAFYLLVDRQHQFMEELINTGRQPWTLIKAGMIKMEWKYSYRNGHVHDKIIQKFEDICIDNVAKLIINSYIHGVQPISGYEYFEYDIPEDWTEERFYEFIEQINFRDNDGNSRYSDYANNKLWECAIDILVEPIPEKKLWLIDNLLSITHMSTDLAAWFVEGGYVTLNELRDWREDADFLREASAKEFA